MGVNQLNIIADTHTHTIASTHAYSTILENAKFASEQGLKILGMTDHAPGSQDSPHLWHFNNLDSIPDELYGVRILRGAEINIIDYQGNVDLPDSTLKKLEWVIASMHGMTMPTGTVEQITSAYIAIAQNPYVDVIGHSGSVNYLYDFETAIKAFKEYHKLVEINQNTFKNRKSSISNCVEIAKLCKKYQVPVVVNSDAHFAYQIGQVDDALALLKEIDFPQELIVNLDLQCFTEYLSDHKKITLSAIE